MRMQIRISRADREVDQCTFTNTNIFIDHKFEKKIKTEKLQNVTKLRRKCSCRYEAEQCVPDPGAAGININSMGSWLAIYIWLMSNKYIHQTKIFFFLLLR